jgi:hypothetical protein
MKKFSQFYMKPDVIKPYSEENTNASYPERDESNSESACLIKLRLSPEQKCSG